MFEKMMEMSPGVALPQPADFTSPEIVATSFTWWAGGFALLVLPWVFKKLTKENDSVPLMMWLGGLVCSLLEPMLDHMGHLWWSVNLPGPVYKGYGLEIPLLIPPCYVFFIAMTGYWAYTKMKQGLDVKGVFKVWLWIAMSDVIMEIPGTATGAYQYYGDTPFKVFGFPLAWGWLNGTSMLMVGFLLWLVAPYLQTGWRRLLVVLVPVIGMGAAYGMVAWPYFIALNWPQPVWATYLWTLFSLALALITTRFVAAVVTHATQTHHQAAPLEALLGKPAAATR